MINSTTLLIYGTSEQLLRYADCLGKTDDYAIGGFLYANSLYDKSEKVGEGIEAILINPKEIERKKKQELLAFCLEHHIKLLATPNLTDWKENGKIEYPHEIEIEELLERIPIPIDTESIKSNLKGKTVMVTGAAGSIGSEIVRQLSRYDIGMLMLCDNAETPLHELCLEMDESFPDTDYTAKLCNVQDHIQMKYIIEKYRPDYIYHAAAYKHVPLMENHPCEAVLINVAGTKNLIDLAVEYEVGAFVMISTDKAVNPGNIMGATKCIAEMYVQALARHIGEEGSSHIRIITTRFGNVLGSNGSVIPLFKKQIEKGGPVTVTDPKIIRYFMTISEACRLVLEAGNLGKGGEVFLFDMGDPVKIKDMAEEMIYLSGHTPYKDIDIVYTGLRPGEKLYEEMLYDKEKVELTHNKKIVIGSVREYDYDYVKDSIERLIALALTYQKTPVVKAMKALVPEFISQNSVYSQLD